MHQAGEITILLQRANAGERDAMDQLYHLVEHDLRAIVGRRKANHRGPLDGSTTVLVDDAFLRLVGGNQTQWLPGDRSKFFSYVATKVHDLLVEAARAEQAAKRGGGRKRESLDSPDVGGAAADSSDFMLDLHAGLKRLESFAPREAEAFRVYYFLGSTFDECAAVLAVSATEAKRLVAKAKLLLQRELKDYHDES